MPFSAILCLATYDWFCADGSQLLDYFTQLLPLNNKYSKIVKKNIIRLRKKGFPRICLQDDAYGILLPLIPHLLYFKTLCII